MIQSYRTTHLDELTGQTILRGVKMGVRPEFFGVSLGENYTITRFILNEF